jgi:anti-sigma factor RsiW
MSEERRVTETELHAYLDGELDNAAREDVEAWLADHPEDAARLDGWRRQRETLRNLHQDVLDAPLPAEMRAVLNRRVPGRDGNHLLRIAASVVLLLVGAAGGWFAKDAVMPRPTGAATFVHHAVGAHVVFTREKRHAVEAKAQEKHLVRWLSNRVGRTLNPPVLKDAGYDLVGGRLVADDGAPAAQFMYQDKSGQRLTVYVRSARNAKDTAFRVITERGVSAFYWVERPYAYALVGQVDRQKLISLGEIVHKHLRGS